MPGLSNTSSLAWLIASRGNNGPRMEIELWISLWHKRKRQQSESRPWRGVNNASRITYDEWKTPPVEKLVIRHLLTWSWNNWSSGEAALKLRCTSSRCIYVKRAYWFTPTKLGSCCGEHQILFLILSQEFWHRWPLAHQNFNSWD